MSSEIIMLSEIDQPQRHKYHVIPLMWDSKAANHLDTENDSCLGRAEEKQALDSHSSSLQG